MGLPRWVVVVIVAAVVVLAVDIGAFVFARDGIAGRHPSPAPADSRGGDRPGPRDGSSRRSRSAASRRRSRAGYGGAWVLNKADGTVTHIDGRVAQRSSARSRPTPHANALTVGAGGVWFAGYPRAAGSRSLETAAFERIDPATDADRQRRS